MATGDSGVTVRVRIGADSVPDDQPWQDPSAIEGELAPGDQVEDGDEEAAGFDGSAGPDQPDEGEAPEVTDDPATWPIVGPPSVDETVQQMHMPCPRCRVSALPGLSPVVNPQINVMVLVFNCLRCGTILAPVGIVSLPSQNPAHQSGLAVPGMMMGGRIRGH